MAKEQGTTRRVCQLVWDGTDYTVRLISYDNPRDDTDPSISYDRTGTPLATKLPRALSAGELGPGVPGDGSLLSFFNSCDSEIKTAEGIV